MPAERRARRSQSSCAIPISQVLSEVGASS